MLPIKFQVNWPFCSGEAKIDFKDGGHGGHLGLKSSIFDVQVTPMFPVKSQVN